MANNTRSKSYQSLIDVSLEKVGEHVDYYWQSPEWDYHQQKIDQIGFQTLATKKRQTDQQHHQIKKQIRQQVLKRLTNQSWVKKKTEQAVKKGKLTVTLNRLNVFQRNPLSKLGYRNYLEQKYILEELQKELQHIVQETYGSNFHLIVERGYSWKIDYQYKLCLSWTLTK